MDAFDNHRVRTIALQFATRLGKTFLGQCLSIFVADVDPAPSMHANSTETLAKQVLERTYKMIRGRSRLKALLLKKHEKDQRQDLIEFVGNLLYGAWARSVSTLADKDIKFQHGGEVDKWEQASTSKEADPLELFLDRAKNYQSTRKVLVESTPTVKGSSRIENFLQAGTYCRLYVPCPECRRYQTLEMSGIKWDHPEGERSDPALAFETARYVCKFCESEIYDHSRNWMIRRGVWAPQGCEVIDEIAILVAEERITSREGEHWRGWSSSPWVAGVPYRDGPDASYQLSSLYALTLSWGDIAKKWVECQGKAQKLRNFVNQWLGETWESRKSKSTSELVAERIGTDLRSKVVPAWARFLTVTIDQQAADGGFVVFVLMAHGPEDRVAVIGHGMADSLAWVWDNVCTVAYPFEDAPDEFLIPKVTAIDSGWNTRATYQFCQEHEKCFPLKGADSDLGGQPYRVSILDKSSRTNAAGQKLILVATDFWETDLQHRLDEVEAGEDGSLSLSRDVAGDFEYLDQLLNATVSDKDDSRGNARLLWVKKDKDNPNDFRDATRYGLCLGAIILSDLDGRYPPRSGHLQTRTGPDGESRRTVATPVERRPDGREWL